MMLILKKELRMFKDVSTRWKAHLLGKKLPNPSLISEEVVICANDLTPSDTATLNKNFS